MLKIMSSRVWGRVLLTAGVFFAAGCTQSNGRLQVSSASRNANINTGGEGNSTVVTPLITRVPALLRVTGSPSVVAGACAPYIITVLASDGAPVPVSANLAFALNGNGTGSFSALADCSATATSLPIANGASGATFYFKGKSVGTVNLTVALGTLPVSTFAVAVGLGAVTQIQINGAANGNVRSCIPFDISLSDASGNGAIISAGSQFNVSIPSSGDVRAFSEATCAIPTGQITAMVQSSTLRFYLKSESANTSSVIVESAGLNSATFPFTFKDLAPILNTVANFTASSNPLLYGGSPLAVDFDNIQYGLTSDDRGMTYVCTFTSSSSSTASSCASLPGEASFSATGVLNWKPSVSAYDKTFAITVVGTNGTGSDSKSFSVYVTANAPTCEITIVEQSVAALVADLKWGGLYNAATFEGVSVPVTDVSYRYNSSRPPGTTGTLSAVVKSATGQETPCSQTYTIPYPVGVAANAHSFCGIKNGAVKCWGYGGDGQMGNGTTNSYKTPQPVVGMDSGVTAIAGGLYHFCAIKNGGAYCWGANNWGNLGNGNNVRSTTPVAVSGLSSGVTAISAGYYSSCAVQNGVAKCWGSNDYGQLGIGTDNWSYAPVPLNLPNVTALSSGDSGSCAVSNGAAYCWGYGGYGELGQGNGNWSKVPVAVSGMNSGVTAIFSGRYYSCGVQNGALKCWGDNANGQLGNGNTTRAYAPVSVSGMGSGVTGGAGGFHASCAIQDGGLKCFGYNGWGALGNGNDTQSLAPIVPSGITSGVQAVGRGEHSTCAVVNGTFKCWGYNGYGELGNGTNTSRSTPGDISF